MTDTLGLGISNNRGNHTAADYTPDLTPSAILASIDTMIAAFGAAAGLTPVQYYAKCTPNLYTLVNTLLDGTSAGGHMPDNQGFPHLTIMDGLRDRGIVPHCWWGNNKNGTPGGDGTYFDLAKITDGSWDTFLNAWFDAAAAWAAQPNASGMARNCQPKTSTIILRWNQEMNMPFFPWQSGGASPNTASEYIAAWRYIANKRTARGATNVKMFWCPWGQPGSTSNFATYWPGANYVDYMGFDAYGAKSMQNLYTEAINALNALPGAASIPIIIGETGRDTLVASDADMAAWFSVGIPYVAGHFSKVKSICYFDYGPSASPGTFNYSFYDDPPNSPNTQTIAAWANQMVLNTRRIA